MAQLISNPEVLKAIVAAGASVGMKAHQIKAENVYEHSGPKADALKMALETLSPAIAAKLRSEVVGLSAGAVLARTGTIPMTEELHVELMGGDIEYQQYVAERQEKSEAAVLEAMDAAADKMRGKPLHEVKSARGRWSDWEAGQTAMDKAGL